MDLKNSTLFSSIYNDQITLSIHPDSTPRIKTATITLDGGLANDEDHIDSAETPSESALAFWEETLFQMGVQAIVEDACEDYP
nr:unnamed protein product [Spirometra erinaceieuropaei]